MVSWKCFAVITGLVYLTVAGEHGATACTVRGYDSLLNPRPPTQRAGLFVFHESIPCTGLLKTVEGRGYCISDDNETNGRTVEYRMRLHIARINKDAMTFDTIPTRVTTIAGDCGNGRSGSFSKYLNVEVMAGDYIAVEVAEGCTTEGNATVVCPFLPVAATTDNTSQIWHSVENRTTRVSGLLIGIKADIYPSCCVSGFESLQNVSTPPLEYQAGLFVVTESIACTGTLNYVEGQGATLSDDNGTGGNIVQYRMKLHIARRNRLDRSLFETIHVTPITIDTSGPFNISLDLEVMAGDFIAVEVARDCITDEANNVTVCPFLPVAATADNTARIIRHSVDVDLNNTRRVSGLLIAIRAHIGPQDTCPSSPTTIPTGLVPTGQPLIPTVAFPVTVVLTPSLSVFLKSPPAAKIYSSTTIVALSVALPFVFIHCVLLLSISMLCVLYKRHKTGQGHSGKKQNPRVLNESLLEPPQTDLEPVTLPPRVNSSNYYSISLNPTNTIRTRESSIQCSNPMSIDNNADFQPHLQEKITLPEPNYEFDSEANNEEGPYWEPSNIEEELKAQLGKSGVLDVSKDNIQLSDELGSGEFGVVRRGVWSVGGEEREVAVKSLTDGSTEEKRIQFLQEAAIMGQFKHPNVISLHGVLLHCDPPMLVVEMMTKGNLKEYLLEIRQSSGARIATDGQVPATLLSFCRQVTSGMTYLAGRGFIHRDLAARNILVSDMEVCKIADFGMSRALQDSDYYVSRGGKIPVKWTAPEALHYKKYSTASDVWSFGMVMYEIWSLGMKPYHNLTNIQALHEIEAGHIPLPPSGCPRNVYLLMILCWRMDPESRPVFPHVLLELQHPDFKLLTWTAEDVAAYTEEARTLGAPLEAGEELFSDLRQW